MQEAAQAPDARHALAELAQRYWYPVYAYLRRCGHASAQAEDIARRFLHHLLGEFRLGQEQSSRRHYRSYLLEQLQAFLAGDWRAPTRDVATAVDLELPGGLELRYQRDHAAAGAPEQAYQRSFALEVLGRALRRLRREAMQTDHLDMFAVLEPYLAKDPGPGEYELLAKRLESRPLVLVVALKRLRQRLRELTGEELADTVGSADDLVSEHEVLLAVLRERRP
jgi:RNA polymerase sigma-70 factor (ECF subfamily)